MTEYFVSKTKRKSFPWRVYDRNGNEVFGLTKQSAINQYIAIYGDKKINRNLDISTIDKVGV